MTKPKVAFVCVHNSCRSQMAEAISKILAADVFEAYSGGTGVRKPAPGPTTRATGEDKQAYLATAAIIREKVLDLKKRIESLSF